MYLLTRPLEKQQSSFRAWQDANLQINIVSPFHTPELANSGHLFNNFIKHPPAICIVVSTIAAEIAVAHLGNKFTNTQFVAIGESTHNILNKGGIPAIYPIEHTSESLLELPIFNDVAGKPIALIKGKGGRDHIRLMLTNAGAMVYHLEVYERKPLSPIKSSAPWKIDDVRGVIVTSLSLANALLLEYPDLATVQTPWLTVSERIAQHLRNEGLEKVAVNTSASDAALIKWVQKYWE